MSSVEIESYMIYNPVYRRIRKYIKRNGYRNYIINTWNVCLDSRKDVFDMKLIWVKGDDRNFIKFMDELIESTSQYFDFWDKSLSLSVPVYDLTFLEDFLNANKLWHFIEKIQTVSRLSLLPSEEKMVTFHPKILLTNVLPSFNKYRSSQGDHRSLVKEKTQTVSSLPLLPIEEEMATFYRKILIASSSKYRSSQGDQKSLVMAKAYGWLTPLGLNHFKKKIRYRYAHVVIYLLLDYFRKWRRRRNIRVLNLFDLCSLRLAMFDPRYYQFDQCELPDLIHSEFCHIVECQKKINPMFQFNVYKYFMELGIKSVPPIVAEFFTSYSYDYCNVISIDALHSTNCSYLLIAEQYIRLYGDALYEDFIIDFIRKRPFLDVIVLRLGRAITPNLLGKLLDLENVSGICIEVDFPVVEFEPSIFADRLQIDKPIGLTFRGTNENNYLPNYMTWLSTLKSSRQISLQIICMIPDFTIFNSLNVSEIEFEGIEINPNNIFELSQIEQTGILTRYKWKKATLAKNGEVLKMIQAFPMVQELDIVQDENTFETIFRFIEDMLQTRDCNELEFGSDFIAFNIIVSKSTPVINGESFKMSLSQYLFRIDSEQNKIEVYDKKSENVVDLYDIIFQAEDSTQSYDFYQ